MGKRTVPSWLMKKAEEYIKDIDGFIVIAPHWYKNKPTFSLGHEKTVYVGLPTVFFWDGEKFCEIPFPKCFDYLEEEDDDLNIDM